MIGVLLDREVVNLICLAGEYAIILCLFWKQQDRPGYFRFWISLLPLLGISYLYFTPDAQRMIYLEHTIGNFLFQLVRLLLYWGAVFGHLIIRKEMRQGTAAHAAGFLTAIYLTVQNIRIIILLLMRSALGNAVCDRLSSYLVVPLEILLVAAMSRSLDLPRLKTVGGARWGLLSITALLGLYFKWSLMTMMTSLPEQDRWRDVLVFAFCAALATLASLFLFELSQQRQAEKQQAQLEQVYLNYEMQNIKRTRQTDRDMRRLYHDMKNHLLAIQGIAEEGGRVEEYLEELLPQFERYESQVSTGNPTVDALLSEKAQQAAREGVRFNIYMDLSPLCFMKPADLVALFGNAVDNAMEAVQELPPGVEKLVYLKSSSGAGLFTLRISNPFPGRRVLENGTLHTSKQDKAMHGIGLVSIQKAARRYGGTVSVEANNEKRWFTLTVIIPEQNQA